MDRAGPKKCGKPVPVNCEESYWIVSGSGLQAGKRLELNGVDVALFVPVSDTDMGRVQGERSYSVC